MMTPTQVDAACERLRLLSLLGTFVALFLAAALAPLLRVEWSPAGAPGALVCIIILFAGGAVLRRRHGALRLATFAEGAAVMMLGTIASAALAMVALRSGAPMEDSVLESVDSAFGLSAQSLVAWIATWHMSFEPLRTLYNSAFGEAGLSLVLLSLLGRRVEAWRLTSLFIVCLLSCVLVSFAIPAYGSFVHAAPATIRALPAGAGTFWWQALDRCRFADTAVLGLNDLGGVVAFPSFHTIIAMLTMQAWFWNRWARVPVIAWNLAMLFTTLPIGGHYFVDLVAGILLWLGWSAVADRVARGFDPFIWRRAALAA